MSILICFILFQGLLHLCIIKYLLKALQYKFSHVGFQCTTAGSNVRILSFYHVRTSIWLLAVARRHPQDCFLSWSWYRTLPIQADAIWFYQSTRFLMDKVMSSLPFVTTHIGDVLIHSKIASLTCSKSSID